MEAEHDDSSILCIAGFIGEEDAFVELDRRFEAVLETNHAGRRGCRNFTLVDCVPGGGNFKTGGWRYAEWLAVHGTKAQQLSNPATAAKIMGVGAAALTSIFREIP